MHEFLLCYGFYVKPNSSRKEKNQNMIECHCTPTAKQIFKKSTFLSSNIAIFRKIHTLFHTYKMAYLVRIMGKDYCKCRGYQNLQVENHWQNHQKIQKIAIMSVPFQASVSRNSNTVLGMLFIASGPGSQNGIKLSIGFVKHCSRFVSVVHKINQLLANFHHFMLVVRRSAIEQNTMRSVLWISPPENW